MSSFIKKIKSFLVYLLTGRKKTFTFKNDSYSSKLYTPYYNCTSIMESVKPKIFNIDGELMDTWFIRDEQSAHCPYRETSRYFLWDRYSFGLDTHFYTHESMLETMGKPTNRYGLFVESEFIVPESYKIFEKNTGLNKDFDKIFTYSEELLDKIPNAKLFTSCATLWYGQEQGCDITLSDTVYLKKTKNVSMVCSNKVMTEFHRIRHDFANEAKKLGTVDIFGSYNNGEYLKYKSTSLQEYRFQIVVENGIAPYYFTEKILDCFGAMTIPIYLGASKVSMFFNEKGIIFLNIKDVNNLDRIISRCNEKLYEEMLPYVIENYHKVLKYKNMNDRLYEENFITNKI